MNLPALFILLCLSAMLLSSIWFGVTVCRPKKKSEFDLEPFFTEDARRRKVRSNLNTWKTDGVTKLIYINDGSQHKGLARLIWEKDGFALAELPDGTEYVLLRGEYSETVYPIEKEPEVAEPPRVKTKATQRTVAKQVDEVSRLVQEMLADDSAREIRYTQQTAPQPTNPLTNPLYVCPVQGCKSQWDWSLAQCSGCGMTVARLLHLQSLGREGELMIKSPLMHAVVKGLK